MLELRSYLEFQGDVFAVGIVCPRLVLLVRWESLNECRSKTQTS
jgi:hypothetical protein